VYAFSATYKPSISESEKLAQFFGVPISMFLPKAQPKSRASAVFSASADLDDDDLEEVMLYAQFRKARRPVKTRPWSPPEQPAYQPRIGIPTSSSRILPRFVARFVIICGTNCQQFCQPTEQQGGKKVYKLIWLYSRIYG
jgi:hypothetical protein